MENIENKKIAIVHDFLVQRGGAERVLECISEMFPDAPIFTILYDREGMKGMFNGRDIRTSFVQKFPRFLKRRYVWLAPLFPVIPETFDLRDYDLIISSSGAWSKGIVTKLNTKHIAYIHSPMRFVWDYNERYLKERGIKTSIFKRMIFSYMRIWDFLAAQRPECLIANSEYTRSRIRKYYRRESSVIYPPVSLGDDSQKHTSVAKASADGYFLVVSRLSGYKKTDAIIESFNKLNLPLIVVGDGKEKKKLEKIAGNTVKIVGWKSDEDLAKLYAGARALIFVAEEDFGMVPVEAMLFGVPVIAYRKGGLLEIVEESKTGEFFDHQTPEVISDGVRRFMDNEAFYDKDYIMKQGERFSKERFKKEFGSYVKETIRD